MRTIISGLALGGAIAAASATMAGACQFHQTMATNDQTPPSQVAQGDAPAPAPAPIVPLGAPVEPAGQTQPD